MITRRVLLASTSIATVLVAVAAAGAARANNCPAQTASIAELRPATGTSNVPVNAVIAFGTHPPFAPYDPGVTLTSNGGAAIPGALETGPGGVWIFRPNGTLSPNTVYNVSIVDQGTSGGVAASASFTTGTSQDLVDPGSPSNVTLTLPGYIDPVEQNGCSKPGYWDLHVAWQGATNGESAIYAVEVDLIDLQPELAPYPDASFAAGTPYKGVITSALTADVGVPQDSQATATVYALDIAGRQSHSQPATILVPIPPQHHHRNSCDVAAPRGGAEAGWLAAIAAGVVALVVRRRRVRAE